MTPNDVFKKINDLFISYYDSNIEWEELKEKSEKIIKEFGIDKFKKGYDDCLDVCQNKT